MNPNLFMAVFWLFLGVGLVVYHGLNPDEPFLRLRGFDFSPGWLAIFLAMYNLVRWWGSRSTNDYEQEFEDRQEYLRNRGKYSTIKPSEPDPNFDFSQESGEGEGEKKEGGK